MQKTEKNLADFINQVADVSGVKKIIAVASAKGGVGKSTIACNLAIALSQIGVKTALLDADIYGPSIPSLMNLQDKPEVKNDFLLPIISNNIKCISIGNMIDANSAGVWRGPMVTKILHQPVLYVDDSSDVLSVNTTMNQCKSP